MKVHEKIEAARESVRHGMEDPRVSAAVGLIHEEERRTLPGAILLAAGLLVLGSVAAFAAVGPLDTEPAPAPAGVPPGRGNLVASMAASSTASAERAGEHASQVIAELIFAEGVDTEAELAAYALDGDFNGERVMGRLDPLVAEAERKRAEEAERKRAAEAERKRAAEAARKAAAAETASRATGTSPPAPATESERAVSSGTTWSRGQVEATLRAAAGEYGLSAGDTGWIVSKGADIAWRESRYRTAVVNSSGHAGLFQFSKSWGSLANRTDPVWSCYRFVRVFRDGGKAKIQQHWAATY